MRKFDLALIISLTAIQFFLVWLDVHGIIRSSLGFLFVALLPGYTLITIFYRRFGFTLTFLERLVLSVPLSLALSTIIGLVLSTIGLGTSPKIYALMTSLVIVIGVVASFARSPRDTNTDANDRRDYWGLLGGLLVAALFIGLLAQPEFQARRNGAIASLYILDAAGRIADYPVSAQADTPIRIRVGVTNQSNQPQDFQLSSSLGEEILPILQPGQTWERQVDFSLTKPGLNLVSWTLVSTDGKLRRSVQLWINVH